MIDHLDVSYKLHVDSDGIDHQPLTSVCTHVATISDDYRILGIGVCGYSGHNARTDSLSQDTCIPYIHQIFQYHQSSVTYTRPICCDVYL